MSTVEIVRIQVLSSTKDKQQELAILNQVLDLYMPNLLKTPSNNEVKEKNDV